MSSSKIFTILTVSTVISLTYASVIDRDPVNPDPTQTPSDPNPVSWQSAFFGLLLLALNAMTQASSLDGGFLQSSLLYPGRSSPFICITDTIENVAEMSFYMFSEGMSLREAAASLKWHRVRCRLGELDELEVTTTESNPKTFGLLAIGVILQAVKLFGMRGLPWIQVWAGMYMIGWACTSAILIMHTEKRRNARPEYFPELKLLGQVCYSVGLYSHLACCAWTAYQIFPSADGGFYLTKERSFLCSTLMFFDFFIHTLVQAALVLFLLFCLLLAYGWCQGNYRETRAFDRAFEALRDLILRASILVWVFTFAAMLTHFTYRTDNWLSKITFGRGGSLLAVYFAGVWLLIKILLFVRGWLGWEVHLLRNYLESFALSNILLLLLYFRLVYDPTGTVKPDWTENLG